MFGRRESIYDFRAPTQLEIDRADARSQMNPDADKCGCRGRGWILTNRDVWRKCAIHYSDQTRPDLHYSPGDEGTCPEDFPLGDSEEVSEKVSEESDPSADGLPF